jgi:hypothetical protein
VVGEDLVGDRLENQGRVELGHLNLLLVLLVYHRLYRLHESAVEVNEKDSLLPVLIHISLLDLDAGRARLDAPHLRRESNREIGREVLEQGDQVLNGHWASL